MVSQFTIFEHVADKKIWKQITRTCTVKFQGLHITEGKIDINYE